MVQLLGLNTNNNLSFYAIPAAWAISFAPHLYAVLILNLNHPPETEGFDFSNPRKTREKIADAKLPIHLQDRYQRAEAANDNSFISLPLFAAAIVAGNLARLPTATLNKAAAIYLASRLTFNGLYIYGTNNAAGLARTVVWVVSAFTSLRLFVQAGKKFSALP